MLVNPGKLSNLIDAVKKSIYIDDGFSLVQLAEQMANLSADNIVGQTIPTEGEQIIDGQDVLVVDPAKVQQRVDELINGSSTPSSSSAPASSSSPSQASASTSTSKAPIDSKCIH
jgi:anionic cell wall polymer biosynthesis LytR-Cps2A-Psr (LCP) family protein